MRVAIDIGKVSEFGIGTHIWNLVHNLSEVDRSSEYLLLGSRRQFLELGPLGDNFQALDVPEEGSFWNANVRIPLRLSHQKIDILHVPHYEAPLLVPARLVVTVHDCVHLLFPQEGSSRFHNYRQYLYTKHVLRWASHVIAVSGSTRQDLIDIFDLPEDKVSVVHNALDGRLTVENDPGARQSVLERYQLNDPFVLYAGQIKPHKNIDRLIEAFAVLKSELAGNEEYDRLKLIIIGDEIAKHPTLRLTVVRSGVQNDVRFFGFVPSPVLQVFYESAAVFASPSLHEGFGLSPLEAMANSTPVVASNTASLPEVLDDAAILVNPENVFEIARAIKQVLLDPALREQAVTRGRQQVKKFSWRTAAERVVETYRAVTEKRDVVSGEKPASG